MAIVKKKAEPLAAEVKTEKAVSKAEKAPAKRRTAAPKVALYVQYAGKQVSEAELVEAVKAGWTGAPIKTLNLYVKPEDGFVYYVVNGDESGKLEF